MNVFEIKSAVDMGCIVNWSNPAYEVRKNKKGDDYNIVCTANNYTIGLTWQDGKTLNGKEEDFYINLDAEQEYENKAHRNFYSKNL